MKIDYSGMTVLVTGSSSGIGSAVAQAFAASNGTVAVHYRTNEEGGKKTVNSLKGNGHLLIQGDISESKEAKRIVDEIVAQTGRIDIVVNNAALIEQFDFDQLSYEEWTSIWERTLAVNLLGHTNVTFCAIQQMKQLGGGRFVNISSRGAFRGEPTAPAYGASKAGINAFGQSMAQALIKHNIFIFTLAPGYVETDRVAPILEGMQGEGIKNQSPFGRVAKPEEVAQAAVLLAAQGNDFMTGCIVDINGASYLRT
ncbi:MAG: SDR family oxidoreductase [Candidatus Neomarinimicrobiota bacterium]|nr:SDR family oxidoreductase [Candidatus Neomarinimicrobiota bacterium]